VALSEPSQSLHVLRLLGEKFDELVDGPRLVEIAVDSETGKIATVVGAAVSDDQKAWPVAFHAFDESAGWTSWHVPIEDDESDPGVEPEKSLGLLVGRGSETSAAAPAKQAGINL